MEESGFTSQLRYAVYVLTTPLGAIGVMLWVLLLVALLFSPKVKWFALIGMMGCASLSFYVEEFSLIRLAFPLEQIRAVARPVSTAFLFALLLPAVLAPRGNRRSLVSKALVVFFIFEMLLGLRIFVAGVHDRAVVTMMVYPLLFIVFAWGLSKWIQDWDDAHRVVRCIAIVAGLYVLGTCYQLAVDRGAILRGIRLFGISGNPQLAAMLISLAMPATCYLVARKGEPMWFRTVLACQLGFMLVLLLWTGSRTGLAVATMGVLFTFWARIGRFIAVGILVALFVMLAYQIYGESTMAMTDMLRRGDTRSHIWRDQWQQFLSYPVMGYMEGSYGVGENSYLSIAAAMGFFGIIPLLAFLLLIFLSVMKSLTLRRALGIERHLADMCIGAIMALLTGAMFEGFLLGTLTVPVFVIYITLTLLNFANDMGTQTLMQAAYAGEFPGPLGEEMVEHQPVGEPYYGQFT